MNRYLNKLTLIGEWILMNDSSDGGKTLKVSRINSHEGS